MRIKFTLILWLIAALSTSCAGKFDIFPSVEDNMSNPITVVVDSVRNRLYINNSNYKVSYNNGSIHIVDISDPTNPTRINYVVLPSFNGEMYLDTTNQILYTPNRFSSTEQDREDSLFGVNVNEDAADFLSRTDYASTDDPYGIFCCDAANRMLTASEQGFLDYYDMNNSLARGYLDITTDLDTGANLSGQGATRVTVIVTDIGNWAAISNSNGGIWLVNLDELGVAGKHPVDYIISDVIRPEGMQTDGTLLYVVSQDYTADPVAYVLLALDLSTLAPLPDNTVATIKDKEDDGLLVASVDLVVEDPRELILVDNTAYVAHFSNDLLSIVDIINYAKTGEIAVGDEPYDMAVYSPDDTPTHLIVTNSGNGSNSVSMIDLATIPNTIVGTYP